MSPPEILVIADFLISNGKRGMVRRLDRLFHHLGDFSGAWATLQLCTKLLELCRAGLCLNFDIAVRQIPHPSSDTQTHGCSLCEVAKSHSLHSSANTIESSQLHHCESVTIMRQEAIRGLPGSVSV